MNIHRFSFRLGIFLVGVAMHAPAGLANGYRQSWTDSGHSFAAGALGNAGQNLYVNQRGELEVIRRYDLDGNGHLDLLFNSTHDTYHSVPATLVSVGPDSNVVTAELRVEGSSRVISHDLNRDGFIDLVFMPNRRNVQHDRTSLTIAWGGADGWSTARLTRQLPVNGAASLAIDDFDADGWPDILTLNKEGWLHGQPRGRILRVYWGGPEGYFLTHYQDIGIPNAIEIAAGVFGGQREYRAAVLTSTGSVHYLAANAKGVGLHVARTVHLPVAVDPAKAPAKLNCMVAQTGNGAAGDTLWVGTDSTVLFRVRTDGRDDDVQAIEARPATHLACGRLDDDPWPDLVLTHVSLIYPLDRSAREADPSVTILWGASDGMNIGRSTALSIPNAISTAIGDLNDDRNDDLIVSVHQGDASMKASSRIYLGDGTRKLAAKRLTRLTVPTEGAKGVAIARPTPQSPPVAIFANSLRATLDSAVPLYLYWGSAEGFSTKSLVKIPNLSGYKSSAADLNCDGLVDLVVVNGGDVGEDTIARAPFAGANIYWGGLEGRIAGPGPNRFDPDRRLVLREPRLGSINVADLNGDGFLDLVLGAFESSQPQTDLVIYYGSRDGLRPENRKVLRVPDRSIGCLIADFNRDGRLDIIVGGYVTNRIFTYWGGSGDYNDSNRTILPYTAPIDLEAADLNGDGWLDLVVASYHDPVAGHHDTGLSIFWGRAGGWTQAWSQWLPAMTPVGLAIGDLDMDGYLDIVSPHYHGELTREHLPSYIYWGSAQGYGARQRTSLTVDSASEVTIGDFDGDGKPDLAFAAHSVDPGHLLETPIFFNDGNRFHSPRVQYLPVVGPHYGWVQDIGNIYHRRNEETFTSRTFTWDEPSRGGRVVVDAATAFGSRIGIHVRSAPDEKGLASASWRSVRDASFAVPVNDRALQYRLDLVSANGDAYPLVRKVTVSLE